jgi:hypothetical protein
MFLSRLLVALILISPLLLLMGCEESKPTQPAPDPVGDLKLGKSGKGLPAPPPILPAK